MARRSVWRRYGAQAGVLVGVAAVFAGRPEVQAMPPGCQTEAECGVLKPLLLFNLDYSTSNNMVFEDPTTRWQAVVGAVKDVVVADNGYLAANFMLALMRFGNDPNPNVPGTMIPNDSSGIVDGQKLDVAFYDSAAPEKPYYECGQDDAILAALDAIPAPINGNLTGIGSWTKGSLDFAKAYFAQTAADHPNDMGMRPGVIILFTDGEWTDTGGTMKLAPASQNPGLTATELLALGIPTHVIALGEAFNKPFADQLATAGGTGMARDIGTVAEFGPALAEIVAGLPPLDCQVPEGTTSDTGESTDGSSTTDGTTDGTTGSTGDGTTGSTGDGTTGSTGDGTTEAIDTDAATSGETSAPTGGPATVTSGTEGGETGPDSTGDVPTSDGPDTGVDPSAGSTSGEATGGADGTTGEMQSGGEGGCGCDAAETPAGGGAWMLVLAGVAGLSRRRRTYG